MTIQQAVSGASSEAIKEGVSRLKRKNFSSSQWVGRKNRYKKDTIDRIKLDTIPKSPQMVDYLAASTVLHNFDGWNYFSRSIESLLSGDLSIAIHLAYYAELRATMSFLASEGIGVFDRKHCWIDASGDAHFLSNRQSTHVIIWELMNQWINEPQKATRILELFYVNNKNFLSWLSSAEFSQITSQRVASEWLSDWSLDFSTVKEDRSIRNEVSYRPQRMIKNTGKADFLQIVRSVISLWELCEPSSPDRFGLLDKYLLRNALEQAYKKKTGQNRLNAQFKKNIISTMQDLGMNPTSPELYSFLIRETISTSHDVFSLAKLKSKSSDGRELRPLAVIARALLLLRLASASLNQIVTSENLTLDELRFWWNDIGIDHHIWDVSNEPLEMSDLWADIEDAIDTLDTASFSSAYIFRQAETHKLSLLTQFQRAGFWAMGLEN